MYNKLNIRLIGALTSKPYAFTARSWELERIDFVDFFDSMLSNIVLDLRGFSVMRVLPRINEILNEEWITDKVRFSYDGFRRQRLIVPLYRESSNENFSEITWEESFFCFYLNYSLSNYDVINNSSVEAVAGSFIDTESLTIFKDFFSSFQDSEVSLKMQNTSFFENYITSDYLFNFNLADLDKSDFCLLIGVNLRYENPILNLKLLRSVNNNGLIIFTIGVLSNLKYKSYSFGNNYSKFLNYLEGKNPYSLLLARAKNPLIIVGDTLRQRVDSRSFVRLLNIFKNLKIYLSSLSKNVSQVAALDLGFTSFNSFFHSNNKILYLYGADEIFLTSNKNTFIVYQGHHGDKGASISNLILPSTFLIEKKGSFLNMFGKSVKFRFAIKPSLNVRTDWRIFRALSLYFNTTLSLNINSFMDLVERSKELIPAYSRAVEKNYFSDLLSNNLREKLNLRFSNTLIFSLFVDYYVSDIVSRSSRIMSLSATRFKNFFINF